jgi:hypothetical protein
MLMAIWMLIWEHSDIKSIVICGGWAIVPTPPTPKLLLLSSLKLRLSLSKLCSYHRNLIAARRNPDYVDLPSVYEGYASCPIFTAQDKLILAEFKYDGGVDETFFSDQEKPRYIFFLLKRYFFPHVYWNLVPRGLWGGRKGIKIDI